MINVFFEVLVRVDFDCFREYVPVGSKEIAYKKNLNYQSDEFSSIKGVYLSMYE